MYCTCSVHPLCCTCSIRQLCTVLVLFTSCVALVLFTSNVVLVLFTSYVALVLHSSPAMLLLFCLPAILYLYLFCSPAVLCLFCSPSCVLYVLCLPVMLHFYSLVVFCSLCCIDCVVLTLCSVHWLCCIDCVLFTGCVVLAVFCSLAVMYWLYSPDTGCQGDQEAGEEPWSWVTAFWCQGFVAKRTPGWFLGQPVVAMAITGARRFNRQSHAPEADQRCCILSPFGVCYAPPPAPLLPTGSLSKYLSNYIFLVLVYIKIKINLLVFVPEMGIANTIHQN